MLRLLIPFLFLLSSTAWGTANVRFYDANEVDIFASSSTAFSAQFELNTDESGESTSDTTPAETFLPFTHSAQIAQRDLSTLSDKTLIPTEAAGALKVRLKLKNDESGTRYLYAAYKSSDGSTYKIAGGPYTSVAAATNVDDTSVAIVNLASLCAQTDMSFSCSDFNTTSELEKSQILYFFLTDETITQSIGVDVPGDHDDGVYLKVSFSNRSNSANTVTLESLRRGDNRLIADYTGSGINDGNRIMALVSTSSFADNQNVQNVLSGKDLIDLESTDYTGKATIRNLVNGTTYFVAILFENKFFFATKTSNVLSETPQNIQALLEKQACFILSAGFQEEHFVTDFFQDFRDTVLGRFWLGRKFIRFYYRTAPHYTGFIIKTPWVAATIRFFAYILYGLLNYWWLALPLLLLMGLYIPFKRLKLN